MRLLSLLALPTLTTAYLFTISLPPFSHPHSYNPSALPASTHSTLYKYNTTLTAPVTRRNTFEYRDLPSGSYLLTIHCRDWTYSPGRVDVNGSVEAVGVTGESERKVKVDAWQTFWGNEWGNKGEWWGGGVVGRKRGGGEEEEVVKIEVRPRGKKEYYTEKQGFSPLDFLKSPMILMGGFSLLLIVGLPYIMDNMDEETKAEFEEAQKSTPGGGNPAAAIQNFDLAGWMAGRGGGGEASDTKK